MRSRLPLVIVAAILASALLACEKAARPLPPTPPPPPPSGPPNFAKGLVGNWYAGYPGGPLKASIGLDPMLRGINYVATISQGSKEMQAGMVVWRGSWDRNVPNLVKAQQVCTNGGPLSAVNVEVVMQVIDADHFTESLMHQGSCKGYPVKWTRIPSD